MHLILSILAGFLGSLVGAAARVGVDAADRRLHGEPAPDMIAINSSPSAGLAAGLAGLFLGTRRAFWIGAVLSAAGSERLDARLLAPLGLDLQALTAKAREAALEAAARARGPEAEPDQA